VIVLDWVMPGISGVEVCRFLRSRSKADAQIGILLLTAHRAVEQIVEVYPREPTTICKALCGRRAAGRVMAQIRAAGVARARQQRGELESAATGERAGCDDRDHHQGRLTFANQEAARMLGQSSAELNGKTIADLFRTGTWPLRQSQPARLFAPCPT
jgi:two-component system phosphate regulon sensor histidine kinase PhoR